MQAYRVAPRPGSVTAPRAFLQQLRRETRCEDLHCWWEPSATRTETLKDGSQSTRSGCWVVWQRIRVCRYLQVGTRVVGVVMPKWVSVFLLDGEFGNPVTLGPWVAKAMNASDETKRGGSMRAKFLNDLNERDAMQPHIQAREFAEAFTKDAFVKRMFAQSAERRGVRVKTKEDVDAELRVLEARRRREWAEAEAAAKALRHHREHWQ